MHLQEITYTFKKVKNCNMCGAGSSSFSVMGRRLSQSQGLRPKRKNGIISTVCKCNECGLIFSNPIPIPASIDNHYGTPPEQYWKPEYFHVSDDYFQGPIHKFLELSEYHKNLRALDIGAGIGKCMIALENAGIEAYGFEPSKPFFERAINEMKISRKKLKLASIESIDYSESFFDFVSFGAVLEHLYDPSAAINKAMGWLKPGGLMYFDIPSSRWLVNKLINAIYKIQGTDYVANISPMHPPFHLYEFDLASFKKHAENNNYEIAYSTHWVCETYLPKILDPLIKPIMKRNDSGMQLEIWLKKKGI